MQHLKDAICLSPPFVIWIIHPDVRLFWLSIPQKLRSGTYILSQEGEDRKRYPNRFGSLTLTDVESRYSQAKVELYGLFRGLWAVRIFIFRVANLTVEMDAKYVKVMINNPDLQPNATIN